MALGAFTRGKNVAVISLSSVLTGMPKRAVILEYFPNQAHWNRLLVGRIGDCRTPAAAGAITIKYYKFDFTVDRIPYMSKTPYIWSEHGTSYWSGRKCCADNVNMVSSTIIVCR